jgi:hypothetical protein
MSQTALERRDFPVPMRWPHAGSDLSRPGQRGRRAVRSSIRFKRLLRCLFCASNLANVQIRRSHSAGIISILKARRRNQIPIAPVAQPVPNFPRLRALALFGRRPPQRVDSVVIPASKNLHNLRTIGPRATVAAD